MSESQLQNALQIYRERGIITIDKQESLDLLKREAVSSTMIADKKNTNKYAESCVDTRKVHLIFFL